MIVPTMIKDAGLGIKLMVFILASTAAIFAAAFWLNYTSSREAVLRSVEESTRHLAGSTVSRIEVVLQGVEKVSRSVCSIVEEFPYSQQDLLQLLKSVVADNSEIYGSAVAFEPNAFLPEFTYFAPYSYRKTTEEGGTTIASMYLGGSGYDYFFMDWYQLPKELRRAVWSEPYFDEGAGNVTMATFSVPFFHEADEGRRVRGVVTADISLDWLQHLVGSIKIYQTGFAYLISQNGFFLTHPVKEYAMRRSVFSVAEERNDGDLRRIGRDMIRGGSGFVKWRDKKDGRDYWFSYAPLPSSGWSLGLLIPEEELFADLHRLSKRILFVGVAGFLFLALTVAFISGTITRPLRNLAGKTDEIARGNLDVELPELRYNDEIGRLNRSFREMKTALKEYIANLAETTAAKERIESELKIARTIQMSFLPKKFPPFPDKKSFDIFASLKSAWEVGGDLYDFFLLGDDHLFFTVGDVSGKGVPAALFMAVSKTLLKGVAEPGMEPSEVLNRVNLELCRDNESMMFVTVFCGVLNIRTGELVYSNAAHNPPVLLRAGQNPQWLKIPKGFLLGTLEESRYETMRLDLKPGDSLLVYTDGVTEAMNGSEELYGNERLLETVRARRSLSIEGLVNEVMDSVDRFADGAHQADDITLLALHFKGNPPERRPK